MSTLFFWSFIFFVFNLEGLMTKVPKEYKFYKNAFDLILQSYFYWLKTKGRDYVSFFYDKQDKKQCI